MVNINRTRKRHKRKISKKMRDITQRKALIRKKKHTSNKNAQGLIDIIKRKRSFKKQNNVNDNLNKLNELLEDFYVKFRHIVPKINNINNSQQLKIDQSDKLLEEAIEKLDLIINRTAQKLGLGRRYYLTSENSKILVPEIELPFSLANYPKPTHMSHLPSPYPSLQPAASMGKPLFLSTRSPEGFSSDQHNRSPIPVTVPQSIPSSSIIDRYFRSRRNVNARQDEKDSNEVKERAERANNVLADAFAITSSLKDALKSDS